MTEKDLLSIYDAMRPLLDREIDSRTQSALRMKSMVVTTAYNSVTETVGVTEAFGNEMQLPVFGGLDTSLLIKGVPVWIMMPYGSMSNAVVFTLGDMTGLGGGGGGGNTTYTFATGTTNGTFDVTPSDTGVVQSVPIFGLGSAAYTDSTDYASASSVTHIGTYYSGGTTSGVTIANNSAGTVGSIQNLPAGTYVAEASVRFGSNTSGTRAIALTTDSTVNPGGRYDGSVQSLASSGNTVLHTSWVFKTTAVSTLYVRAYQQSGSSLSNNVSSIHCVRIK